MKKLFVAFVTLSLVLWTVGAAFASFEDVEGTDYENPVTTLNALGILKGYPDGTFKPDATITRAEFAAVAVRALGQESAAGYSEGQTPFADVPATHWASGYINVACQQGLLQGYPDGTFKPSNNVTYAEALAILVRALGYDPTVKGAWPTNYIIKASELGITADLTFLPNAPATRGDVALFTDESLTVPMLVQSGWGDMEQYVVDEDKTLLEDKLGVAAKEGRVVETGLVFGTTLDEDELVLDMGDDGTKTYSISEALDMSDTLGLEVKAWVDGSEIIAYEVTTDDENILEDTIVDATDVVDPDPDTVELDDLDDTLDVVDDAVLYLNNAATALSDAYDGAEATVVVNDDDEVVAILATVYDDVLVVTDVDLDDEEIEGFGQASNDPDDIVLELGDYDTVLFVGAAASLEDIEELDVIHYFEDAANEALYLLVVRSSVAGELDEVQAADEVTSIDIVIDGEEFDLADSTFSTDDNDDVSDLAAESDLDDFVGEDVTVLLDKDGNVRHIFAEIEEAPVETVVGFVIDMFDLKTADGYKYYVRLLTENDEKVSYEVTDDTSFEVYGGTDDKVTYDTIDSDDDVALDDLVELELASDGTVDTYTEFDPAEMKSDANFNGDDIDDDYNLITVGGMKYKASGAVFFNLTDEEALTWDVFEDISLADENSNPSDDWLAVDAVVSGKVADYVLFSYTPADVSVAYAAEADYAMVLGRGRTADGATLHLLLPDGDTVTYLAEDATVASTTYSNYTANSTSVITDIDEGDLIEYALVSGGDELDTVTELEVDYNALDASLTDVQYLYIDEDGVDTTNFILDVLDAETGGNAGTLIVDPDAVVFDVTDDPVISSFSKLREDYEIQAFDADDDGVVDYIKITDK